MPCTEQKCNTFVRDYTTVLGRRRCGSLEFECLCTYILIGEFALKGFQDFCLRVDSLQYSTQKLFGLFKVKTVES